MKVACSVCGEERAQPNPRLRTQTCDRCLRLLREWSGNVLLVQLVLQKSKGQS